MITYCSFCMQDTVIINGKQTITQEINTDESENFSKVVSESDVEIESQKNVPNTSKHDTETSMLNSNHFEDYVTSVITESEN